MRRWSAVPLVTWLATACAPAQTPAGSSAFGVATEAVEASMHVAARDRLGRPTFVRFGRGGPVGPALAASARERAALAAVARVGAAAGVHVTDPLVLVSDHAVGDRGAHLIAFGRREGVPFHDAALRVLLRRDGVPLAVRGVVRPPPPALPLPRLRGPHVAGLGLDLSLGEEGPDGRRPLQDARGNVRGSARPVWFDGDGKPRPLVRIEALTGDSAHRWLVDPASGEVVLRTPLVSHDAYTYRVFADGAGWPVDSVLGDTTPHPTGTPDGWVPPYAPSVLRTLEGWGRPVAVDPWLPPAAVRLDGQHASAYADWANPDGFGTGDLDVPPSSIRTFDRTVDPSLDPVTASSAQASATHAFYVVHSLHDYFYESGFDELAGNAQRSNHGLGGVEGDPLKVEVQNGAAVGQRNDANMLTLEDGVSPVMQLFLFTDGSPPSVVSTPGGALTAARAEFGPATFDVSGTAYLANDATGSPTDACEPLVGPFAGKVVVAHRGGCTFERKVSNAQLVNAVGVLVVNDKPGGGTVVMSGDSTIVDPIIPSASTTYEEGATLVSQLGTGVTLRLSRVDGVSRDSALDTSVVAHEWGHYLHQRPALCGTPQCGGLSEGWADFVALHFLARTGDDFAGTHAVGSYLALTQSADALYYGPRRVPYSIDFAKNALTFGHVANGRPLPTTHPVQASNEPNAEVHNTGEVWATALFEVFASLVAERGGDVVAARRFVADAMVAGLQLAPDDATFTESRDALLAGIEALDPTSAGIAAAAFARRGLGTCAVSPARDSTEFTDAVETFELAGALEVGTPTLAADRGVCDDDDYLDAGETGEVLVPVHNAGYGTLTAVQVTLSSPGQVIGFPSGATLTVPTLGPLADTVVRIPVDLASIPSDRRTSVQVAAQAQGACTSQVFASIATWVDVDVLSDVTVRDDFETGGGAWTVEGDPSLWSFPTETGNVRYASARAPADRSTASLVSPELVRVPGSAMAVAFRYRHSLEADSSGRPFDGVVFELSADGGATYRDISDFVPFPYAALQIANDATTDLANRRAFGGISTGYPAYRQVAFTLPATVAPDTVRFRFRLASDAGTASGPFDLDDFEVLGVSSRAFSALVPDPGCGLTADAGGFDADVPEGVDASPTYPPLRRPDSGCGCRAAGHGAPRGAVAIVLALSVLAIRRRAASGTRDR